MHASAKSSAGSVCMNGRWKVRPALGTCRMIAVIATPVAVKSPIVQSTAPRTTRERSERRSRYSSPPTR